MEHLKKRFEEILQQEPLSGSGLTLVGIGSDKVVFESAGSTKKLIKISQAELGRRITQLIKGEGHLDDSPDRDFLDEQKTLLRREKEDEQDAVEIFGEEHFLRKGVFKIKVPLTKNFLITLVGDGPLEADVKKLPNDFHTEIKMLAETQLVAEELKDPEKFSPISFNAPLITERDFHSGKNISEALLKTRAMIDGMFSAEELEDCFGNELYRPVIREIVSKLIQYTKKTGEMIDIFGPNNITIYKKEDGSINYHLIEAMMPGAREHWARAINQDPELGLLRHYYSYFYSVNHFAEKLGMEGRLDPEDFIYFRGVGIPTGEFPK